MRAIVTGGAGFIGSHVVDALAARGAEVVALVQHREDDIGHPCFLRPRSYERITYGP